MEFAKTVTRHLEETSAILLANHGAVTFGRNIMEAWAMTESLENYARIMLAANELGELQHLQPNQVARLIELRNDAILDLPRS
jgi:L-fuculose-phosphate aldolase